MSLEALSGFCNLTTSTTQQPVPTARGREAQTRFFACSFTNMSIAALEIWEKKLYQQLMVVVS